MHRFRLEIVVFLCGAAVMILELVGSRVLAPYLGTSTFVWTSLIGIVLGCLSVGYYAGGKLADRRPDPNVFALIILLSGLAVGAVAVLDAAILVGVSELLKDVRASAVAASLLLFGVPSVLFGMVLPYAVRLKITGIERTGTTVGTLYALSTVGSIVGTFLAGFVLISYFGNRRILVFLSVLLVLTSVYARGRSGIRTGVAALAAAAVLGAGSEALGAVLAPPGLVDVDTPYSRVWIFEDRDAESGRPIRIMQIANESSSAMYLDRDGLVLDYTEFYRLAEHFRPGFRRALMVGGAAYSFPKYFLEHYPDARLDVVEIDPELTELARRHFGLRDDARLGIFHEDGRTFLNRTRERYDVIYADAYKSLYAVPHQLTTVEAVRRMDAALEPGGLVLLNLIGAIEGPRGLFLRAELATFRKVFPQVYLFAVTAPDDGGEVQNVVLAALKSPERPHFHSKDRDLNRLLLHLWVGEVPEDVGPLTDEFAPVERYVEKVIAGRRAGPNPVARRIKLLLGKSRE
jgi:spermidine synthase